MWLNGHLINRINIIQILDYTQFCDAFNDVFAPINSISVSFFNKDDGVPKCK